MSTSNEWSDCVEKPLWDFHHNDYRIKPEPHYRPFKNAKEVMEVIKEHGDWITDGCIYYKIIEVTDRQ